MTRRVARWVASALFLLVLTMLPAGCAGGADQVDTGVSSLQFQDMVVPQGFRLEDGAHQSHSREEGDWRMGRFYYTGAAQIADAAGYVKQRMPQHNWALEVEELGDSMQGRLRFARGRYVAEYTFTRLEGTTRMVVDYQTDYTRR
ncbi:MAG: hypothetical protein H6838_02865 [Planctomycetes bacterium]|nr:hypothetical protein [Planctomycetota bacterium]